MSHDSTDTGPVWEGLVADLGEPDPAWSAPLEPFRWPEVAHRL